MLAAVVTSLFTHCWLLIKFTSLADTAVWLFTTNSFLAVVVSRHRFNGDILQRGQTPLMRWFCRSLNSTKHVRHVCLVCRQVSPQKCKVTWEINICIIEPSCSVTHLFTYSALNTAGTLQSSMNEHCCTLFLVTCRYDVDSYL